MTGKIFKESSNVYEDEAKILFDYYKKAAEKIVEEEIALENKIEEAINNKNTSQERQKKHKLISIITGSVSLASLIGGVVTFFPSDDAFSYCNSRMCFFRPSGYGNYKSFKKEQGKKRF